MPAQTEMVEKSQQKKKAQDAKTKKSVKSPTKEATNDKKRKISELEIAENVETDDNGKNAQMQESSSRPLASTSSTVVNLSPEDIKKGDFSNFPLSAPTIKILKSKEINFLFPIQVGVFNHIYEGKDLVGRAKTGTGKTLSFVLPIVEKIRQAPVETVKGRAPRVLVMVPTRELAKQVHSDFELFAPNLMKTTVIYGGVSYEPQERAFKNGVDVIVGTPGRLMDHLERGYIQLNRLKYVILDEADQMLDIGFADAMDSVLSAAKAATEAQPFQTLFFSATIPKWVQGAVKKYCQRGSPVIVDLVEHSSSKSAQNIEFLALKCGWHDRAATLRDVLTVYSSGRSIVFTETKAEANELLMGDHMKDAQVLHGDIAQFQRELTLKAFRDGKFSILIATNVAARGLDIPEVDLIIQLEPPKDVETFIHRSGRTARAGKSGRCIIFFKPQQEGSLPMIERQAGISFKRIGAPQPHQILEKVASQKVQTLSPLDDTTLAHFKELTKLLLEQFNGDYEKALATTLAHLSGYTAFATRSLLSCAEGWVTYQINVPDQMKTKGFIWSILSRTYEPEMTAKIQGMRMLADKKGVVFDLPRELEKEFKSQWSDRSATLIKPTSLPEVEPEERNFGARSGGSWGARSGGNFGARSGGNFGARSGGSWGARSGGNFRARSGFGGRGAVFEGRFAQGNRFGGSDGPSPKRIKF